MTREKESTSVPTLFLCPTCGANLPVPETSTVKCEYCGSKVLVPDEFRPTEKPDFTKKPDQIVIQISDHQVISPESTRRYAGVVFVFAAIIIVIGVVIALVTTPGGLLAALTVGSTTNQFISNIEATSLAGFPC